MTFNSIDFLLFFPAVVFVYYCIPSKFKYIWLLIASYYFYLSWDVRFLLCLLPYTFVTYSAGMLIGKAASKEKKYLCVSLLAMVVMIILGILGSLKYADFLVSNINRIISLFGLAIDVPQWDMVLPIGFSFYSLQGLGYLIDIYRKRVSAERNILKYALFLSFFPIVMSGPIERAGNLLRQINTKAELDVDHIRKGLLTLAYGLFLKLVVADQLAAIVSSVIHYSENYRGCEIAVITIMFGLQIYCDFNGYSQMAIGSAKILGIDIIENFKSPYLAANVKEFWRRWHISLTSWFTEYLYIPLGGSRRGNVRKYINTLIVFGVSGLWHGASLNFVAWGLLNGSYLVLYDLYCKYLKKKDQDQSAGIRIAKSLVTFVAIDFAWFFFMMPSMREALTVLMRSVVNFQFPWFFSGYILDMIPGRMELFVLMCSIAGIFAIDYAGYHGRDWRDAIFKQNAVIRWCLYIILLFSIIFFGAYGEDYEQKAFIYFNF